MLCRICQNRFGCNQSFLLLFCLSKSRFLRVACTGFYLVCTECTGMTRDSSDDRFSPEAGRTDRRKNLDGMYPNPNRIVNGMIMRISYSLFEHPCSFWIPNEMLLIWKTKVIDKRKRNPLFFYISTLFFYEAYVSLLQALKCTNSTNSNPH